MLLQPPSPFTAYYLYCMARHFCVTCPMCVDVQQKELQSSTPILWSVFKHSGNYSSATTAQGGNTRLFHVQDQCVSPSQSFVHTSQCWAHWSLSFYCFKLLVFAHLKEELDESQQRQPGSDIDTWTRLRPAALLLYYTTPGLQSGFLCSYCVLLYLLTAYADSPDRAGCKQTDTTSEPGV